MTSREFEAVRARVSECVDGESGKTNLCESMRVRVIVLHDVHSLHHPSPTELRMYKLGCTLVSLCRRTASYFWCDDWNPPLSAVSKNCANISGVFRRKWSGAWRNRTKAATLEYSSSGSRRNNNDAATERQSYERIRGAKE